MMTTHRTLLPLFALGFALGACKADAPPIDSGIDGSKLGRELSPAEQIQFCEAAQEQARETLPPEEERVAGCTFAAIVGALALDGSQQTCETLRKNCLQRPPPMQATGACNLGIDWANCKATIDEIEACREERMGDKAEMMRSLACNKMAEYMVEPPMTELELGDACILAQSKCPTVIGGPGSDL